MNDAVDKNKEVPNDFKCIFCNKLIFEPKECKSCGRAAFCGPCVREYLGVTKEDLGIESSSSDDETETNKTRTNKSKTTTSNKPNTSKSHKTSHSRSKNDKSDSGSHSG